MYRPEWVVRVRVSSWTPFLAKSHREVLQRGVQRAWRVHLLCQEQREIRVLRVSQVQDQSQRESTGQGGRQVATCQVKLQDNRRAINTAWEHKAPVSAYSRDLRSAWSHLHERPLQSRRGHLYDQNSCQEESNQDAANPLQEPLQLQLCDVSLSDHELKLLEKALRHCGSELPELPTKRPVLHQPATEVEHELPRTDADKRYNQKNPGIKNQKLICIL